MEHHGKNQPKNNVIAVIPARYASTRLPGKMLISLAGKPLVLHTADRANEAALVQRVIIAADDQRIVDSATNAGFETVLTSVDHNSGSDRIAEVAETLPEEAIIVNLQGDEPVISPAAIDVAVKAMLDDPDADIVTICEPITEMGDVFDPNIVKAVIDDNGYAVYFSRSAIPFPRDAAMRHNGEIVSALTKEPELLKTFHKHVGLYVYRREFLLRFTKLPQSSLEKIEMLEQLRALENGAKIRVVKVVSRSIGVDTAEDLELVRAILEAEKEIHEIG